MNFCKVHVNLAPPSNWGPAQFTSTWARKKILYPSHPELTGELPHGHLSLVHWIVSRSTIWQKYSGMGLQAMKKSLNKACALTRKPITLLWKISQELHEKDSEWAFRPTQQLKHIVGNHSRQSKLKSPVFRDLQIVTPFHFMLLSALLLNYSNSFIPKANVTMQALADHTKCNMLR